MASMYDMNDIVKAINNVACALILASQETGETERNVARKYLEGNLNG